MVVTNRYMQPLALLLLCALTQPVVAAVPISSWQTDNGARIYYVHAPQLPMVDIRITFDAGSARDGAQLGIAQLTNAMLGEGARQGSRELNTDQIAERFDAVGANFSTSSLRDMAILSLRSLTDPRRLKPALETLAAVLNHPTFPSDALRRVRRQQLLSLRYAEQSPGSRASRAFYAALYANHPYAKPSSGEISSVEKLGRGTVESFYRRYYVARNLSVAIVGDLSRQQAEGVARQLFGTLPAGRSATPLPPVAPLASASAKHIEHPSTQTHILVGQPGVKRGDPDYFPLYVGNHILGGSGLISRISDQVREKRGLAYSAYSYFSPMREQGPFILGLQTRNDQSDKALAVVNETLREFLEAGPTAEELQAAKSNIVGGFALKVDSNKDIVGYLGMIGFYRLPADYLDRFTERVEAVTLQQINSAFRQRIDADRLVTITVGDSL